MPILPYQENVKNLPCNITLQSNQSMNEMYQQLNLKSNNNTDISVKSEPRQPNELAATYRHQRR